MVSDVLFGKGLVEHQDILSNHDDTLCFSKLELAVDAVLCFDSLGQKVDKGSYIIFPSRAFCMSGSRIQRGVVVCFGAFGAPDSKP